MIAEDRSYILFGGTPMREVPTDELVHARFNVASDGVYLYNDITEVLIRRCIHCHRPKYEHANEIKCLFEAAEFEAVLVLP